MSTNSGQPSNLQLYSVDMTGERVSDVTAAQVRNWRKRRGWSPGELAARCAERGAAHLTENVIENIESGRRGKGGERRRDVSVDELLTLALVLNVAPVHLLVPTEDPEKEYPVVGDVLARRFGARAWIRGIGPIDPDADWREFHAAVPRSEFYMPAYAGDDDHTGHGAVQQGPVSRDHEDGA